VRLRRTLRARARRQIHHPGHIWTSFPSRIVCNGQRRPKAHPPPEIFNSTTRGTKTL
jgi:hypothetical protein